jgi:hypothetical protein
MYCLTRKRALRAAVVIALLTLFAPSSFATTAIMLTDEQLITSSRVIVIGDIQSVTAQWDSNHEYIHTYVKVSVFKLLKGELQADQLVFKQLGGIVGQDSMTVFGSPDFEVGKRVLLFLNTKDDGTLRVAHLFMGKYGVVDDGLSGTTRVERNIDGVNLLGAPKNGDITNTTSLSKFTKKIKKVLNQQAAVAAVYDAKYKDVPIVAIPAEYDPAGEITPQYTFIGNGYRWFEPDTNQPVLYRVNSTGAPVAGGGVTEINQALAAWTNVQTSALVLQNAGSTTQLGFRADGVSTVSFNDPLGQMQDPVGCSGILAIGGVTRAGSQSRIIGGQTFTQITEGDVVFNNNFACFLGVSTNLAEVTTHEIGHTIGFGHSTDGAAIMYAYAHGGGRGATLGADDVAAVTFLYPDTSAPPPPPATLPNSPSSLTATGVSASQINLIWVDNSNNEDGFKVERRIGVSGNYAQIAALGANVASFSDTGLQPSSTCYYRVRASNVAGNSAYSNESSAATSAGMTMPSAPSALTATAAASSQINLTWTDNSGNENGFKIERKSGVAGTYAQMATPGANVTGYSDTALSAATTYYYRARAYNAAGDSSYSGEASVTTLPAASPNDAAFVSQSVPATMVAGQTYSVSITFRNIGTTTWSGGSGYKLASQNPFNNSTWGTTRVVLPPGSRPVVPGAQITFAFVVRAPAAPGTYNFQWSMWRQSLAPFGELSPNVAVTVTP